MARTLAIAVLLWLVPELALAHEAIDGARARYDEGDPRGTLAELERAEREGPLTLEELVTLYELRVLAHRALGDEPATDRALRALAELAPDRAPSRELPEVLRERLEVFARASSGPPRVEIEVAPRAGGVAIRARVEGDDESLAGATTLRARVAGGPWIAGNGTLELTAPEGARIEWEATARGPGQSVLATRAGEHTVARAEGGGDAWPWIVAGGGALVVVAIVAIAVVAASGVDTRVEGPVIAELRF